MPQLLHTGKEVQKPWVSAGVLPAFFGNFLSLLKESYPPEA